MIKLLYLSVNEWGNMGRRKPRLVHEFAQQPWMASALFVEPPVRTSVLDLVRGRFLPSHLGQDRPAHLRSIFGGSRQVEENLWVHTGSTKTVPLSRFEMVRKLEALYRINQGLYVGLLRQRLRPLPGDYLVVWLTHPLQAWALDAFRERALCCYDWTDDWTAFDLLPVEDGRELQALNDRVLREADLVLTVSEYLYHQAQELNPHVYRVPNASDPSVMGQAAAPGEVAPDLVDLSRPIVGYVGQIADKLDFELVEGLARARPGWSFVFIGDVWETRRAQAQALGARANVHFLGRRDYHQLPAYLRAFDVCAMPHRCTPLTRSMDPIKLYDYLATGKPIVSTPIAGVERFRDVVYVGDTPEAFVMGVEEALQEPPELPEKRLQYAQQNTWSRRGSEIWSLILKHVERRVSCPVPA